MAVIEPQMTMLDVIAKHRQTEEVFRRYDSQAGACLCCQALFDTLADMAARYGLDLEALLADLTAAVNRGPGAETGPAR